jgi:hypothetical protein
MRLGRVEGRVGAEALGRGAQALLLGWRVGAQRVLDAVAELASTGSGMSAGFWVTK